MLCCNDPEFGARVKSGWVAALGKENAMNDEPITAGGDFGVLSEHAREETPTVMCRPGRHGPGARGPNEPDGGR